MESKVAIILVNYNAQQYMDEFLESVYLQDYSNIEVVLVDNASTDSSIDWLKDNAPKVHLIEMQENVGFGEGCNIGMRYATEELGAEYVLLLNIDTVIQPNLVFELQRYADENTVVTAQIYCGEKGSNLELWYAGGEIDKNTALTDQILYPIPESEVYEVGFISGCCMMLHRAVIEKIGYFDSKYFLYYEDTDYCVRLHNAGITMKYVTTTSLWHKVGGSSLGGSEASCSTQYYVTRNRLLFAEKYAQIFQEGNLSILRKILEERAFFDGIDNVKHRFYVQTAIADYLKGYYGKGYNGRALLENGYYMANGFYEKEESGDEYWYWACERSATAYLANHRRQAGIYLVSFDVAPAVAGKKQVLEVIINGKERAEYAMPGHVEFSVPIGGESVVRLDLTFRGTEKTDMADGNIRTLFYQLLNLRALESDMNYCVLGKTYPREQDENNSWQWTASKICKIYVTNRGMQRKVYEFSGMIESVDGNKYGLQIYSQEKLLASIKTMEEFCIPITLDSNEIYELEFKCDAPIVFDYGRRVCYKLKNIVFKEAEEELYWSECFLPEECEEENFWRWATEKQGAIQLVNQSNEISIKKVSYTVIPSLQENMAKYSTAINGFCTKYGVPMDKQQLIVKIMPKAITELLIATEYKTVPEDDRSICFRIQNLAVEDVKENFIQGENFYSIEENETNKWCWCSDNHGTIQIVNTGNAFKWMHIGFNVLPFEQRPAEGIHIYRNGEEVTECCEYKGYVKLLAGLSPKEILEIGIAAEWPVLKDGQRNMCFCISDIVSEEFEDEIFYGSTFGALENDENSSWSWNKSKYGGMSLVNSKDIPVQRVLEFEVLPFGESDASKAGMVTWGEKAERIEFGRRKKIFLEIAAHTCVPFSLATTLPVHEINGQNYCFQMRNVSLEMLQSGLQWGDEFYVEESDGENNWCWCSENRGKLYIVNAENSNVLRVLNFEVMDLDCQGTEFEVLNEIGQLFVGRCGQKYSVQISCEARSIQIVEFYCHAAARNVDGRVLCFAIRNMVMDADEQQK